MQRVWGTPLYGNAHMNGALFGARSPHIRTFSGVTTGFGGVATAGVTGGSTATTGREPGAV